MVQSLYCGVKIRLLTCAAGGPLLQRLGVHRPCSTALCAFVHVQRAWLDMALTPHRRRYSRLSRSRHCLPRWKIWLSALSQARPLTALCMERTAASVPPAHLASPLQPPGLPALQVAPVFSRLQSTWWQSSTSHPCWQGRLIHLVLLRLQRHRETEDYTWMGQLVLAHLQTPSSPGITGSWASIGG